MISDLVFELLPHILHTIALNVFFTQKIALLSKHYTMLSQLLSFPMLKRQMCDNYSKAKFEIMKRYQEYHKILFILNHRS